MSAAPRLWAVVPAAGAGRRLGAAVPKQYLDLGGRSVIDRTLDLLVPEARIVGVWVALDPADTLWDQTAYTSHPGVHRVTGGAERCHSVLRALEDLSRWAAPDDWVLVHDAARPCLRQADLDRLIETLMADDVGGILAVPVRDTMKRADAGGRIVATLDRSALWHAYTPQMFRLGTLREALTAAIASGELVTDEAAAIERMGLAPRLVEGHGDN
ncbi:MAG: 2-C-methyl-D-erythritol 4-phosphate cytidylyltransferase, partial [Anaerolineae bacterium]